MSYEKYIPNGHKANSTTVKHVYAEASKELLKPFPSTNLKKFPKLNMMLGGFRPYEFTILCGQTGKGKTTLAANISCDLLEQDVPQFVASVETGHTDYVRRIISCQRGKDWNTGEQISIKDLQEFHASNGSRFNTDSLHLSLYDNRFKIETLMADIAYHVKNHGVKIAIVDNLNFFLEVTSAQQSVQEMDRVIHEMIIFAKRCPVHIIMVMHPKKTENGRVESEYDVKGSSTAVQEAHNILLWNSAGEDIIESGHANKYDREIMIAKMRRRGLFVRKRLVIKSPDRVSYIEGEIIND